MNKIKILIVEDELLTATDIEENLTKTGYTVVGIAQNFDQALNLVRTKKPDLIMLDIKLAGEKDGIDTARAILGEWSGPVIFLTAFSQKEMVTRAKGLMPAAYLLKPFNITQFAIHLEVAISNFINQPQLGYFGNSASYRNDSIFIMLNQVYQKIYKKEILYLEASGSYSNLQTIDSNYLISTNLKSIENQLDDPSFCRIHRKFLVNMEHIISVDGSSVSLAHSTQLIPVGDLFKPNLFSKLQIIRTK